MDVQGPFAGLWQWIQDWLPGAMRGLPPVVQIAIVLAVLAIGVTVALGAFTKGISGSLSKVTGLLPS